MYRNKQYRTIHIAGSKPYALCGNSPQTLFDFVVGTYEEASCLECRSMYEKKYMPDDPPIES